MFVLHGHRLDRDIVVVLIASVAFWIIVFQLSQLKLETEDQVNLKYGYTESLPAEQRFSQCRDVFWWSRELFLYSTME